jgi:hypothetical protein
VKAFCLESSANAIMGFANRINLICQTKENDEKPTHGVVRAEIEMGERRIPMQMTCRETTQVNDRPQSGK